MVYLWGVFNNVDRYKYVAESEKLNVENFSVSAYFFYAATAAILLYSSTASRQARAHFWQ